MALLESSQWLRELYGEQKGEQKCHSGTLQVETCLSASEANLHRELLFYFKPFRTLPKQYNHNNFDEFILYKL
jgi:hypothetical protein